MSGYLRLMRLKKVHSQLTCQGVMHVLLDANSNALHPADLRLLTQGRPVAASSLATFRIHI